MDTKRYDVGPEQGYRTATTIKLTDDQAKRMGLTTANLSKLTTTADDLTKRDAYEDAMTRQGEMRDAERATEAEAEAGDGDTTDAGNKKRGTASSAK